MKEKEEDIDRRRDGRTILRSGQKLTFPAQLEQLKTRHVGKEYRKNSKNWDT